MTISNQQERIALGLKLGELNFKKKNYEYASDSSESMKVILWENRHPFNQNLLFYYNEIGST
ncbi:MAG: hypothetical protein ACTSRK_21525 [Promethearchaeota archaeon]